MTAIARLAPDAAADARTLTRQLAAAADRSVTQAEALGAAVAFALDHVNQVADVMRTRQESDHR